MKSAGLSSTYRTMFKRTTKITAFAAHQDKHLATKEKQKLLRMQAAKAQFDRQRKEKELLAEAALPSVP